MKRVDVRQYSPLETEFANLWRILGGPTLEREYRFDPTRQWRADFAHPTSRVLVELEGGIWISGRHSRPEGYTEDCAKYNAAAALGYRVFRLTESMLHDDPIGHLTKIKEAIERG